MLRTQRGCDDSTRKRVLAPFHRLQTLRIAPSIHFSTSAMEARAMHPQSICNLILDHTSYKYIAIESIVFVCSFFLWHLPHHIVCPVRISFQLALSPFVHMFFAPHARIVPSPLQPARIEHTGDALLPLLGRHVHRIRTKGIRRLWRLHLHLRLLLGHLCSRTAGVEVWRLRMMWLLLLIVLLLCMMRLRRWVCGGCRVGRGLRWIA
jgi:hypothetical protein